MPDQSDIAAPFFEPFSLRAMNLANRIAMAPMTRFSCPGRTPGPDVVEYYRKRAAGGVGLIITEPVGIDQHRAIDGPGLPVLDDDSRVEAWRKVTDAVHREGGKIVVQVWHMGVLWDSLLAQQPGAVSLRPSGVLGPIGFTSLAADRIRALEAPTAPMTDEEIADIVAAFGRTAALAVKAGFDGVEIHGAHGYLVDAFLWRGTNKRQDRFGGDALARAQFGVEVVKAIRAAIGQERPLMFRFSQQKQQDYDARFAETPEELGIVLGALADAGADMFHASVRRFNVPAFDGSDLTLAGWAKKLTGKPSMTVGGIGLSNWVQDMLLNGSETLAANNLDEVRKLFERGMFDMIAVGRALISDPEWPRRARSGEPFLPYDKRALRHLV